jgi:hypothetical protein
MSKQHYSETTIICYLKIELGLYYIYLTLDVLLLAKYNYIDFIYTYLINT